MHHASMVYQDPGAALNPSTKVGPQVVEAFTVLGQAQGRPTTSALRRPATGSRSPTPKRVFERYPHQLSGGMQQRVVIAIALASDPKLLVLDEPTTGLDATVEASVLDLVRSLQAETNAAVLLIAHNLGVIRTLCDRVGVMYAGKIVEEGDAASVFDRPKHPYTLGLLRSLPRHGVRKSQRALSTIPGNLPQIGTDAADLRVRRSLPAGRPTCAATVVPPVVEVGDGQWSRCHHIDRLGELVEPPVDRRARTRRTATSPWPSRGSPRRSTRAVMTCRRWSKRRPSSCATARPSGSSASPGRASRRWPRPSSASRARTRAAPSTSTTRPRSQVDGPPDRRQSARSRWSSRTRTRRSTGAGPPATSWRGRSAS